MIDELKPYSKYKDPGVPWLGDVPEHWGVQRAKWLFSKAERPVRKSDEVITCFRDGIVTLRKNRRTQGFTESLKEIGYQGIRKGDLVIHAMDAFAGAVGVANSDGKGSPVYSVCVPRANVSAHYYASVIREMARTGWILALAKGIRERSTDFRFGNFAVQWLPFPPLPEQTAIVRFLDWADHCIRRVIRVREKRVRLLEEYKQTLIHQAVTGQIDVRTGKPYPKYKDSGVEWLGRVPEHWEVMPIKRAFRSMDYGISESGSDSGTIRVLRMGDLKNGRVMIPESGGVDSVDPSLILSPGDLLFNRTNSAELVGKVALFENYEFPVTFASYLVRMRPTKKNNPEFLNLVLNDVSTLSIARREAIPSLHQSNLNPARYGRLHIALPPSREQQAILERLRDETGKIDTTIAATHRAIELLKEFRTRLVADVVTGKLDVRDLPAARGTAQAGAAAKLPDEPTEEEATEPMGEDEKTAEVDWEAISQEAKI